MKFLHESFTTVVSAWGKANTAIALAFFALVLPACETQVGPEAGVTTEEVAEEGGELVGQTVTISGEIARVVGTNAFTIQSNEFFDNESVLVVGAQGVAIPALTPQTVVQVVGTVRELVVADVEREYGLDLDPEVEVELKDRPYVAATSVQVQTTPGVTTP
jgi:hypothetical protein